jgi:exopolysaccharide biosynthesis polyprenyl glycosylphosphotransferase
MGQLGANHCWEDSPSQYARMIPGVAASTTRAKSAGKSSTTINEGRAALIRPQILGQILLPHPIVDAFTLYLRVAADLIVLATLGGAQAVLFPGWSMTLFHLPLFAVLVTLLRFSEGDYRRTSDQFSTEMIFSLMRCVALANVLIFVTERGATHVRAIPVTFVSSLGGLLLIREWRHLAGTGRHRGAECRNVLIVGAGPAGRAVARGLRNDPLGRTTVQGFVDDDAPLSPSVLGRTEDLDWLARAEFIDEVILALPGSPAQTRHAAQAALRNHLDIRAVLELPHGCWPDAAIDYIGEVPVVTLHREPVPNAALFSKRLLDVIGAMMGLVLTGPVMGIVALLIRLESPGPVIYAAERTGAKGSRFRCYKFRSMVTNADHLKDELRAKNQREGPIFKIVDDPRITRVGRWIRRYSLDELPQLWNVLLGDMSLVGPRPHPVDEVNHYELHHYRRLDVKPGITGLWQISARHSPSFELNMHLDLTYIENWSLRLDLRILLNTVGVLFRPEGA